MNSIALQRHRVNRVINDVRRSTTSVCTLDEMADIACLSRFHFARVFTAHCRETPISFLTRSRLETSITSLVSNRNLPVTSVALEAGFSGSQAFSHAFRRRYGIGPKRFRDANRDCVVNFPMNQWNRYPMLSDISPNPNHIAHGWSASLRSIPETRLAYIRHIGPYFNMRPMDGSASGISKTIEELVAWAKAKKLWHDASRVIGMCPNNPSITPPEFCQYDVCLEVDETIKEDAVVSIQHLPAASYATLEMSGGSGTLMQAWRWLGSKWLSDNGLRPAQLTPFEVYVSDGSHPLCPENGVELFLPVVADDRRRAKI